MIEQSRFERCLPIILQWEGGYVCDNQDPGGATNLGVTLKTLSQWVGHDCTKEQVRALKPADVAPLYHAGYWLASGCDLLPAGLDLMVFDCAVNQGVRTAVRFLQLEAGLSDDGLLGPVTRAAIAKLTPDKAIAGVSLLRRTRYQTNPNFGRYGKGWLRRLDGITAQAGHMIEVPA